VDLLHNGGFMRLFATRMTGSLGDGVLQAALAAFVVFSPERQATPLAIATSFGILLLPYSFIGPFAGVFLDRRTPSGVSIIDWEFCGHGIWGTDEIRLWSTMGDPRDRERIMSGFLADLPDRRRRDTGILIHWLALRQLAENLAAPRRHQDPSNVRLGHTTLAEARALRERLTGSPG